jgi:hypothetical protein
VEIPGLVELKPTGLAEAEYLIRLGTAIRLQPNRTRRATPFPSQRHGTWF